MITDNTHKPIVVVQDRTDLRQEKLIKIFQASGCECRGIYRTISKELKGPPLHCTRCTLLLIHVRDLPVPESLSASLVVYYGGNGGDDCAIPPDAERIWRRVLSDSGILTAVEAAEVLAFALAIEQGDASPRRPALLCKPDSLVHLTALFLLCQGYLAAHVDPSTRSLEKVDGHESDVVRAGLERMGWLNLDLTRLRGDFLDRNVRERIRRGDPSSGRLGARERGWWRTVLRSPESAEAIQRDWGSHEGWNAVRDLLSEIQADAGEIKPGTVANAFLVIDDRLHASRT